MYAEVLPELASCLASVWIEVMRQASHSHTILMGTLMPQTISQKL